MGKNCEWKVACLWDSIGQNPAISYLWKFLTKDKSAHQWKTAVKNKQYRSVWSEVGNSCKIRNFKMLKITKKAKTVKVKKNGYGKWKSIVPNNMYNLMC